MFKGFLDRPWPYVLVISSDARPAIHDHQATLPEKLVLHFAEVVLDKNPLPVADDSLRFTHVGAF